MPARWSSACLVTSYVTISVALMTLFRTKFAVNPCRGSKHFNQSVPLNMPAAPARRHIGMLRLSGITLCGADAVACNSMHTGTDSSCLTLRVGLQAHNCQARTLYRPPKTPSSAAMRR